MAQYFAKPTLNGVLFSQYNAQLVSYAIGAVQTSAGYVAPSRSYRPVGLERNYMVRPIAISCEFMGEDLRDTTRQISEFVAAMQSNCDILLPDGFYYYCELSEIGEPIMQGNFIQTVSFSFCGYRHGALQSKTITATTTVSVAGNLPAECRYTITPSSSMVKVAGITVTGCSSSKTVIIDGIDKKITNGGKNCFADSDLTDFPKLQPGSNQISISGASKVIVEFYPVWL